MSRRQDRVQRESRQFRPASRYVIEALEPRLLLSGAYTTGIVWNRAADWKPGTIDGSAAGNPITDSAGKPRGTPKAGASTLTLSDGTFSDADWTLTVEGLQNGGTASASQQSTGGNPGAYRQITTNVNSGTLPIGSTVFAFNERSGASYDPASQGAISSIDYSEDSLLGSGGFGDGQLAGLALIQNGTIYYTQGFDTPDFSWTHHTQTALVTSDFSPIAGFATNSGPHPDLSVGGAPITFGFARINNSIAGPYSVTGGIDNWSVTIHRAPTVSSIQVNDGSAQRSMVTSLTIGFSEPVTLAAGAITLSAQDGSAVPFQLSTADGETYMPTFTGSQFLNGSLADGSYMLTVHAAGVTDSFGQTMAADQRYSFFRLFGDFDGNGTVNNADFFQFKKTFGKKSADPGFLSLFDYDGNGTVNNSDFFQFKKRFGTKI